VSGNVQKRRQTGALLKKRRRVSSIDEKSESARRGIRLHTDKARVDGKRAEICFSVKDVNKKEAKKKRTHRKKDSSNRAIKGNKRDGAGGIQRTKGKRLQEATPKEEGGPAKKLAGEHLQARHTAPGIRGEDNTYNPAE